jgi:hypothetical protein
VQASDEDQALISLCRSIWVSVARNPSLLSCFVTQPGEDEANGAPQGAPSTAAGAVDGAMSPSARSRSLTASQVMDSLGDPESSHCIILDAILPYIHGVNMGTATRSFSNDAKEAFLIACSLRDPRLIEHIQRARAPTHLAQKAAASFRTTVNELQLQHRLAREVAATRESIQALAAAGKPTKDEDARMALLQQQQAKCAASTTQHMHILVEKLTYYNLLVLVSSEIAPQATTTAALSQSNSLLGQNALAIILRGSQEQGFGLLGESLVYHFVTFFGRDIAQQLLLNDDPLVVSATQTGMAALVRALVLRTPPSREPIAWSHPLMHVLLCALTGASPEPAISRSAPNSREAAAWQQLQQQARLVAKALCERAVSLPAQVAGQSLAERAVGVTASNLLVCILGLRDGPSTAALLGDDGGDAASFVAGLRGLVPSLVYSSSLQPQTAGSAKSGEGEGPGDYIPSFASLRLLVRLGAAAAAGVEEGDRYRQKYGSSAGDRSSRSRHVSAAETAGGGNGVSFLDWCKGAAERREVAMRTTLEAAQKADAALTQEALCRFLGISPQGGAKGASGSLTASESEHLVYMTGWAGVDARFTGTPGMPQSDYYNEATRRVLTAAETASRKSSASSPPQPTQNVPVTTPSLVSLLSLLRDSVRSLEVLTTDDKTVDPARFSVLTELIATLAESPNPLLHAFVFGSTSTTAPTTYTVSSAAADTLFDAVCYTWCILHKRLASYIPTATAACEAISYARQQLGITEGSDIDESLFGHSTAGVPNSGAAAKKDDAFANRRRNSLTGASATAAPARGGSPKHRVAAPSSATASASGTATGLSKEADTAVRERRALLDVYVLLQELVRELLATLEALSKIGVTVE